MKWTISAVVLVLAAPAIWLAAAASASFTAAPKPIAQKALAVLSVRRQGRQHHLQRHQPFQLRLFGAKDIAHPSLSEQTQDAIRPQAHPGVVIRQQVAGILTWRNVRARDRHYGRAQPGRPFDRNTQHSGTPLLKKGVLNSSSF